MDIIDAHTHVDESEALGWYDPPEKLIGLLDEAGISQAVHPSINPSQYIGPAIARTQTTMISLAAGEGRSVTAGSDDGETSSAMR